MCGAYIRWILELFLKKSCDWSIIGGVKRTKFINGFSLGCDAWYGSILNSLHIWNNTYIGVFGIISLPYEHKTTPTRVWFHVWHLFFPLPSMLSMKQHLCWCCFVFSIFSLPRHKCWIWNDILVGIVLCLVSFLGSTTALPTEHKTTLLLVLFHAQITFYSLNKLQGVFFHAQYGW